MKRIILLLLGIVLLASSCATSGYGCRGKASWNDVIKKANSSYPKYRR
jgi:hypothetical protein